MTSTTSSPPPPSNRQRKDKKNYEAHHRKSVKARASIGDRSVVTSRCDTQIPGCTRHGEIHKCARPMAHFDDCACIFCGKRYSAIVTSASKIEPVGEPVKAEKYSITEAQTVVGPHDGPADTRGVSTSFSTGGTP